MRGRRPRNRATEEYVANKQGRYLGMEPAEVMGLIDAKGGDYYRFDLNPDQALIEAAEGDFSTFRTGTPSMNQVADDMRNYYGLNKPQGLTNMPPELQAMVDEVRGPFMEKVASPGATPGIVVVPVAKEATKAAVDQAVSSAKGGRGGIRKAMEAIALLDNNVQRAIRERLLGLSDRDVNPQGYKAILGSTVFRPNRMDSDGPYKANTPGLTEDIATLLAARGLQAGALAGTVGAAKAGSEAIYDLLTQEENEKGQGVSPTLMVY